MYKIFHTSLDLFMYFELLLSLLSLLCMHLKSMNSHLNVWFFIVSFILYGILHYLLTFVKFDFY